MFAWYWSLPFTVVLIIITSLCITIFLHRIHAHKSVVLLNSKFEDACRFWLWLMGYWHVNLVKGWCALHRKHHLKSDTKDDPHSPFIYSFSQILFVMKDPKPGDPYYLTAEELEKYGTGVPVYNDWMERNVYSLYYKYTPLILLAIFFILFGFWGMIASIPLLVFIRFIGRMHNYLSHKIGYRNRPATGTDHSVNMFPIGFFLSGEEFGANHHDNPSNPKFSEKWWEFDLGWLGIQILRFFKIVKLARDN